MTIFNTATHTHSEWKYISRAALEDFLTKCAPWSYRNTGPDVVTYFFNYDEAFAFSTRQNACFIDPKFLV